MENGHGAAVSAIVLHMHRPLPTSDEDCLFVSTLRVPYVFFAATSDLLVAVYREMDAVSLSPWVWGT